jgi:hypothetical protein
MNKKIVLSMRLPLSIENSEGKKATLELNKFEYIVCRYSNEECYSLNDVDLENWYPSNKFRKFIYRIRNIMA